MKSASGVAGAIALGWGMVVSVAAYAITRAIQHFIYPEPDPATVAWSPHAGFFWRVWTVAYAGGIATFVAGMTGRNRLVAAARALAPAVVVAAGLLVLQSAFLP